MGSLLGGIEWDALPIGSGPMLPQRGLSRKSANEGGMALADGPVEGWGDALSISRRYRVAV